MPSQERKYRVKESWIFNLEAMSDRLWCIGNDIDTGKIPGPVKILGYDISCSEDLCNLKDEVSRLECAAKSRKLTSKEYGRIKEIVSWRVEQRYMACLINGMDKEQASLCFEDM